MSRAHKILPLRSKFERKRGPQEKASPASPEDSRMRKIQAILAEADINARSKEVLAETARTYARALKRLADR
ncbi:MAG TPA: hypothetical protein VH020_01775 [Stellaceae bacterium]|jgi:hypothetical protein|nr:hypothetical protein [Stellaceae bacterium]